MAKEDLINIADRPPEEARAIRSAGGIARQKQLHEEAVLRKAATALLMGTVKGSKHKKLLDELNASKDGRTYAVAAVAALLKNILDTGSAAGFDKLMRLMGEGDVKVDVTSEDNNLFQAIADSIKAIGKAEDSEDDEV
jgi:hypothetical protein